MQVIKDEPKYVEVAKTSDVKKGTMKNMQVEGRDVLIANVDGKFYAMDDRCGHMNALLSMGRLTGSIITCPFHFAQFDVSTGKKIKDPVTESFKDVDKLPKEMQDFLIYAKKLIDPVKTFDMQTYTVKVDGAKISILL